LTLVCKKLGDVDKSVHQTQATVYPHLFTILLTNSAIALTSNKLLCSFIVCQSLKCLVWLSLQ